MTDDDSTDWLENLERPIYADLDEVFSRAGLSPPERDIFLRYRQDCEYWLLRAKTPYVEPTFAGPVFIQQLARMLMVLGSDKVSGARRSFIKEMFSIKQVHKVTRGSGFIRSSQRSSILFDKYFELKILAFLVRNGCSIHIHGKADKPKSEFLATKNGVNVEIEAKNLDADAILDKIHGDFFEPDWKPKKPGQHHDADTNRKLYNQLKQSYDNAVKKMASTGDGDFLLIFIATNLPIGLLGPRAIEFVNDLVAHQWRAEEYQMLLGMVIVEDSRVRFLPNHSCSGRISSLLDVDVESFFDYRA